VLLALYCHPHRGLLSQAVPQKAKAATFESRLSVFL
jgi:hypothetical protein